LGKNKITQLKVGPWISLCSFARADTNYDIQNLSALMNLKILSIQSNRLTEIVGLENLVSLEEFYISHNAIREITGLENNVGATPLYIISLFTSLTDKTSRARHHQQPNREAQRAQTP